MMVLRGEEKKKKKKKESRTKRVLFPLVFLRVIVSKSMSNDFESKAQPADWPGGDAADRKGL